MIEVTDDDKNTPLTVAELKEFCNEFARQLAEAPPLITPRVGDPVPDAAVIGLHSEALAEDGSIMRLYDLRGGRTGAQAFWPGEAPGPVRYT